MPIHLKVETELDESSARAAADAVQSHFRNASRSIGSEFSQGLKAGIDDAVRGASNSFGPLSSQADSAFGAMSSKAGIAGLAIGGIGIAAAGALTELYNLGSEWDSIADGITGKTGIVGTQLDAITESIKNVGVSSSASLSEIGDVAGSLTQSLHLTGQPLEDLTRRITDLDELTGDKLNVRDLGKVFHGFGIEADNMAPTLDRLYDVFTNTGIPVSELIETLKTVGPTAREISPDIAVAAGDIVTLEDAGISAQDAFKGLKIAMGNLSKEKAPGSLGDFLKDEQGKDLNTKIGDLIVKIRETGDIDLAKSAFGKSWQPIFEQIRNGKVDVDTLNTSVQNTGHTIEGSKAATDDWAEEFKKLKNSLVVELEPAAKVVFGGISNMINEWLIKPFKELNNLVSGAADLWHSLFGGGPSSSLPPSTPGVPGVTPGPGGGPALVPPSGGGSPGQNPLDIFAPSGGHPGPPQTGGGGNSFGAGGNEQIVHQAMLNAGWGEDQWPALRNLMQHESGFRNTAENPSGAYGMFQFMPYTWGTYGTGSKTSDPGLQAQYGMQYIKGRYGSPGAAWGQYFNHAGGEGSYDQGGILPPGTTLAQNNTGQPEAVINPQQTQMLGALFGGLQQGGGWGGLIGGFGNMALNASQAAGGPDSVQPGQQPSSRSPGGGDSSGGLIGSAAAMAANTFAPGSGALVQLATRAMKYVGQVASIGIMGGLETFLPGGTPLSDPSKSLIGRVASGIAGGQPASQNMAGAAKPPKPAPPLGSPASGTGLGPPPGPTNNGVHIDTMIVQNGDGEAAARDINRAYHGQAAGDNSR